jgi:NAD-dependent dihydropyrimidine dehydrogenase PreA subunit
MGRFIEISIAPEAPSAEQAQAVVRACPVDIFAVGSGGALSTHPEREDECILCGRCVEIVSDAVSVRRAYGDRRAVEAASDGG